MSTAEAVDDQTWAAVRRQHPGRTVLRLAVSCAVVALVGLLMWPAGALWPRLHADALDVAPSTVPGHTVVTLEARNDGLFSAVIIGVGPADRGPDVRLEPLGTSSTSTPLRIEAGQRMPLRLLVQGCPLDWPSWTIGVHAYGPYTGNNSHELVLHQPLRGKC